MFPLFSAPLWWQEEVLEVIFREIGLDSNNSLALVTPFVLIALLVSARENAKWIKIDFLFSTPLPLDFPPCLSIQAVL